MREKPHTDLEAPVPSASFSAVRVAAGILFAAVFAAAVVYTTLSESQVECEVCMEFRGRSICRTVAAAERNQALQMAISNACAIISDGVTEGMQCSRARPRSISCSD